MSDWKIIDVKRPSSAGRLEQAMSLGGITPQNTYTVESIKTGETRIVHARDENQLGEKINRSDFARKK